LSELTRINLECIAEQTIAGLHLISQAQHLMLTKTIYHPQKNELPWRLTVFTDASNQIGHIFFTSKEAALRALFDANGKIQIGEQVFYYAYPILIKEIV